MFSNLELLLDLDNYENNKTVYLYLESEVREYEVEMVYYCPIDKDENTGEYVYVRDGYEYYYTDYSEDEFNHCIICWYYCENESSNVNGY